MGKLAQHLRRPYDKLANFVENAPMGVTYDIICSRLSDVSRLSDKDQRALLDYTREHNRLIVEENPSSKKCPLIRHPKFTGQETTTIDTDEVEQVATTPLKTSNDTVAWDIARIMESQRREESGAREILRMPQSKPKIPTMPPKIAKGFTEVMAYLSNRPKGATLTDLARHVTGYNATEGTERTVLQNALRAFGGVLFIKPTIAGSGLAPTTLIDIQYVTESMLQSGDVLNLTEVKPYVQHNFSKTEKPAAPAEQTDVSMGILPAVTVLGCDPGASGVSQATIVENTLTDVYILGKESSMSLTTPEALREQARQLAAQADALERTAELQKTADFAKKLTPLAIEANQYMAVVEDLFNKQIDAISQLREKVNAIQKLTESMRK